MKRRIIDTLVYSLLIVIFVLLFYVRYLMLVNEGKALSIEILKTMLVKEIIQKHDSINTKDSIIIELGIKIDSLNLVND